MTDTATLETAMRHALDLASRGPAIGVNPQVGCVLLDASGTTIAEGWHRGAGTPHAEADALSKLPLVDGHPDARGLTAVVTLEPCNHTGRTGPCSEALIAAGIAEVYFAVADPSPVAGGGADRLREAGIPTTGGVLETEAREFQHAWLTAETNRRPYVSVKWASTLDGRAAASDGTSQWITGTTARQRVHEQRAASDAILVGTGTVIADDPSLTARGDAGEFMEHQPIPVVVGERPVPENAKLRAHPRGVIETASRDLPTILDALFEFGIRRLYVEGGPTLVSQLVIADLVDEYLVYLAPTLLGGDKLAIGDIGVKTIADAKRMRIASVEQLGNDVLVTARALSRATGQPAPATSAPVDDEATLDSEAPVEREADEPAGAGDLEAEGDIAAAPYEPEPETDPEAEDA